MSKNKPPILFPAQAGHNLESNFHCDRNRLFHVGCVGICVYCRVQGTAVGKNVCTYLIIQNLILSY